MSKTKIAWTDETANWIVGCTKTRAKGAKESGCDHCYAATAASSARLQQFEQYQKVVNGKGNWNGHIEFVPKVLDNLLKGKRSRRVFAPSMSDPFHPNVKDEWLDQFMATVALTPHITYQVLTKRPDRMLEYFSQTFGEVVFDLGKTKVITRDNLVEAQMMRMSKCPEEGLTQWHLPNLYPGVTVENQAAGDERIPLLLQTPAAKRFISVEPLLEKISLDCLHVDGITNLNCLTGRHGISYPLQGVGNKVDHVIIGGESGKNARPFHLEWARSLIDQCRESGVKVFVKQTGSNAFYKGVPFKTKSRTGTDLTEWPEWMRIQEVL